MAAVTKFYAKIVRVN